MPIVPCDSAVCQSASTGSTGRRSLASTLALARARSAGLALKAIGSPTCSKSGTSERLSSNRRALLNRQVELSRQAQRVVPLVVLVEMRGNFTRVPILADLGAAAPQQPPQPKRAHKYWVSEWKATPSVPSPEVGSDWPPGRSTPLPPRVGEAAWSRSGCSRAVAAYSAASANTARAMARRAAQRSGIVCQ